MHKFQNLGAVIFCFLFLFADNSFAQCGQTTAQAAKSRYRNYFDDTVLSLEKMRGANGLLMDKVWIKNGESVPLQTLTSPTNIALDILVQLERLRAVTNNHIPQIILERILTTLDELPFHPASGLFFSWYETNPEHPVHHADATRQRALRTHDVSSVDNLHLALALWTVTKYRGRTKAAAIAEKILARMDFSIFYDSSTGLVGGNLQFVDDTRGWFLESWRYAHLGSEARSLYSIGGALGLFRKISDPQFAEKAINAGIMEIDNWTDEAGVKLGIFRTWNGGAFQLLLPDLIADETFFSLELTRIFGSYERYIRAEGKRRGLPLPAAHSACSFGIDGTNIFGNLPWYNGLAGSPGWVSHLDEDFLVPQWADRWDMAVTPHAVVLAARANPPAFEKTFQQMQAIDGLYKPGLGWMDAYIVKGQFHGSVVPVQLAEDQAMIALATAQMEAANKITISAWALHSDLAANQWLTHYYRLFDQKFRATERTKH